MTSDATKRRPSKASTPPKPKPLPPSNAGTPNAAKKPGTAIKKKGPNPAALEKFKRSLERAPGSQTELSKGLEFSRVSETDYTYIAARKFLSGLNAHYIDANDVVVAVTGPAVAIELGLRTLDEWLDCVNEAIAWNEEANRAKAQTSGQFRKPDSVMYYVLDICAKTPGMFSADVVKACTTHKPTTVQRMLGEGLTQGLLRITGTQWSHTDRAMYYVTDLGMRELENRIIMNSEVQP